MKELEIPLKGLQDPFWGYQEKLPNEMGSEKQYFLVVDAHLNRTNPQVRNAIYEVWGLL